MAEAVLILHIRENMYCLHVKTTDQMFMKILPEM